MKALLALLLLAPAVWSAEPLPALSLPPPEAVNQALERAPRLRIAHEAIDRGEALARQWRAGPHEWELSVTGQRRTDAAGTPYNEQEYGLQRGLRWPAKAAVDRQLGERSRESGELAYSDAWHEAGRLLLDLWYGRLDAERTVTLWDEQLSILVRQQQAVQRRVEAGDAAQLDLQLAETETRRAQAERGAAAREAMQAREALAREFPDLITVAPESLAEPPALPGLDEAGVRDAWLQRIVDANHEIELAQARASEAHLAADRARLDRLADPTAAMLFSRNLDGNRHVVGLRLSLPLGGPARTAARALALSEARAADARAESTRLAVESAAREAIDNADLSLAGWRSLSEAAQLSRQAADAVARGYGLGEFDITALLQSRRTELQAQHQALAAQTAALRAHARVLLDAHLLWAPPHPEAKHGAP